MRALVYHGPGQKAWEEVADPEILDDGDVIVRVDATTICGTDLHILKGDVPAVHKGRILGHEAVGTVWEAGDGVRRLCPGDRVLVSCISTTGQINVKPFITHHFSLDEFDEAYDVFSQAADTGALKVVLTRGSE